MKHATKQEANAARLAALKSSREKRTHTKHQRWAQEMREAGWIAVPAEDVVTDAQGNLWRREESGMYRMNGDGWYPPRTLAYIQETFGLVVRL